METADTQRGNDSFSEPDSSLVQTNENYEGGESHDHERIEELQRDQENISSQLAHLSEFIENQLVKIDKKVDNIVDTVSQTSSILNSMLEGIDDYPKLYVIVPIPKNNSLVGNKSFLTIWSHAIEEMYNNPKLLFCDECSVRLYPLCAYSMEPVGEGIEILHPKKQIREISFALQLSASILSSLALYSTALSLLIPSLNTSIQSSLRYVSALQTSLTLTDAPGITTNREEVSHSESCIPLDPIQTEIFNQIETGYKNGEDIKSVMSKIPAEQFSLIKPIAKESYQMIRNIFDHADPGLHQLRGLMAPCANIYRNEIQWVKIEYIDAWKYAKLPREDPSGGNGPITPNYLSSPTQSTSPMGSPLIHLSENNHIDAVPYDPWVLVHPPHVSSMDCEDVERISHWLQSEVHLLHSSSESIATKLVMDNCPHIERLKLRLTREPHYLQSLGVSEDDALDIKNILFGGHPTGARSWCNIS